MALGELKGELVESCPKTESTLADQRAHFIARTLDVNRTTNDATLVVKLRLDLKEIRFNELRYRLLKVSPVLNRSLDFGSHAAKLASHEATLPARVDAAKGTVAARS